MGVLTVRVTKATKEGGIAYTFVLWSVRAKLLCESSG